MKKSLSAVRKFIAAGAAVLALSACSVSIDGESYENVEPAFELESFFDGKVTAWGIVQDRSGNVVQRFIVDIDGYKEDDKLILDETFQYGVGDGPLKRVWTLTKNADGTYTGNAGDIAGPATGTSYGNAFSFAYEMDLDVDGTTYRVNFDDWFWAFDENTMMNRSYIKKFGIVMAEVTIFMQKQ
ncbi:DUF3833 family protein [Glaciecola sp. XM2]|jgi:hypothetical protein|uniref:DUF3833 domain-containing protein n=1 Tax=Glaciecola sp. XM2 TaxID=1914931 RepID=UPI001BDE6526|nr:DUF3833 domain-containing protein [Glaciecola sp. XM2]MBT1450425.1 DUF3833 family protein [Glaciecola sp. XM2]